MFQASVSMRDMIGATDGNEMAQWVLKANG